MFGISPLPFFCDFHQEKCDNTTDCSRREQKRVLGLLLISLFGEVGDGWTDAAAFEAEDEENETVEGEVGAGAGRGGRGCDDCQGGGVGLDGIVLHLVFIVFVIIHIRMINSVNIGSAIDPIILNLTFNSNSHFRSYSNPLSFPYNFN